MMRYQEIFDQRGELYNQAHILAPYARKFEGQAMLKWLEPQQGQTIIVTAAGGGFDAKLIEELIGTDSRIVCVEPSKQFASFIPEHFDVINSALDDICLPDCCADAVLNLAALHHIPDRTQVFDEWTRLLKPGGRMVLGDVDINEANAGFLNIAVNKFTPGGHEGIFLDAGELTTEFEKRKFSALKEGLESYTWAFDTEEIMVQFSRLLFGMVKGSREDVANAIRKHLGVTLGEAGSTSYPWSLRFFSAVKDEC